MTERIIPDRTISYLRMETRPCAPKPDLEVLMAQDYPPWYFLALYRAVGFDYYWYAKLNASADEVARFCSDPAFTLYTLIEKGVPAGFFMLNEMGENTELEYFGLTPDAVGGGLGAKLLDYAIATAWEKPIKSMTVETCTLDHPRALALYQSRGFAITHTEFVPAKKG